LFIIRFWLAGQSDTSPRPGAFANAAAAASSFSATSSASSGSFFWGKIFFPQN